MFIMFIWFTAIFFKKFWFSIFHEISIFNFFYFLLFWLLLINFSLIWWFVFTFQNRNIFTLNTLAKARKLSSALSVSIIWMILLLVVFIKVSVISSTIWRYRFSLFTYQLWASDSRSIYIFKVTIFISSSIWIFRQHFLLKYVIWVFLFSF